MAHNERSRPILTLGLEQVWTGRASLSRENFGREAREPHGIAT